MELMEHLLLFSVPVEQISERSPELTAGGTGSDAGREGQERAAEAGRAGSGAGESAAALRSHRGGPEDGEGGPGTHGRGRVGDGAAAAVAARRKGSASTLLRSQNSTNLT